MPNRWARRRTPVLRSDRLDLVPLAVGDADEMIGVLADPGLYAYTGGEPPALEPLRARFARLVVGRSGGGAQVWHNWVVRVRATGEAAGTVQATVEVVRPVAEIAWVIGVPWQGRGYASEAGRALVAWLTAAGVMEIIAHIHPGHAASGGVAARVGLAPTALVEDGEVLWRRTRGG